MGDSGRVASAQATSPAPPAGRNTPLPLLQICSRPLESLLLRKAIAEFVGTAILVFTGAIAAVIEDQTGGALTLVGLAACGGLAVMMLVVSTGHISGAHFNPSVTIAFAFLGHFPWKQVPVYVGAQMAASVSVAFLLKAIFYPTNISAAATVPNGSTFLAFVMEYFVGFNLMFVAAAVTDSRAVRVLAAIAVGATVSLNVLIAGEISGASLNPARTFGPAIATNDYRAIWVYFTAPVLGAVSGAYVYAIIRTPVANDSAILSEV